MLRRVGARARRVAASAAAPIIHWQSADLANYDFIDVRDQDEFAAGHARGARNIPLNALRSSLGALTKIRPLAVYCAAGGRAHNAVRLLRQHGFDASPDPPKGRQSRP